MSHEITSIKSSKLERICDETNEEVVLHKQKRLFEWIAIGTYGMVMNTYKYIGHLGIKQH